MTILRWILGVVGALFLLLLLWLGYQVIKFRRLQVIVVEYLVLQDAEDALAYIEEHPLLLTDRAEVYIQMLMKEVWAAGEAQLFVPGVLHLSLLVGCQEYGTETARRMAINGFQRWFDALTSPSWQRALDLLGPLLTEGKVDIPSEEVDEDLVEAMEQVMELLHPLAADEETIALQDEILRIMRRMLEQKAK